jgi:hypothetical protein
MQTHPSFNDKVYKIAYTRVSKIHNRIKNVAQESYLANSQIAIE